MSYLQKISNNSIAIATTMTGLNSPACETASHVGGALTWQWHT